MDNYIYKDLPITPSIIEVLIIELFNGQMLKRDDIVNAILEHHVSKGGLRHEAQDFHGSVKKALARLQERGDANNRAYGYWEINKTDAPISLVESIEMEEEIDELPA